jgi:beta-galactosidase
MNKPTRLPASDALLYGADYNPDQWRDDDTVLRADIRLMKEARVTSASVGIFSWTALEPEPGRYTFGWLDDTMDRFAANGLRVFLATPSGSKPMWLSEAHPEVRRVDADGNREPSGGRHNHCPTSPIYRDFVRRINRALADRYGRHPALALWHVGNELNGECHCPLCRAAFHEWLRDRYGDLAELNRAWWTGFWNHTYTDWTQVPTRDPSVDGLTLDWKRFVNAQHCSFLEDEMAPLREITPQIPCTTNFMGTHPGTNYWQWAKLLDCIANDHYPQPDDRDDAWRKALGSDFTHSLMRGLAGGDPWILMECSPSAVNWGKVNKLKRPRVHQQEVLQAVANGADVIHYFQWRKGRGGCEKFHGAVVDHEGSANSRVFQECAVVGQTLEHLAGLAGVRPEKAPVALVYDWESRWALDASVGPKHLPGGNLYTTTCVEHFRALRTAGVDVDIVPVDGDFSGYRAVITPALYLLSAASARHLAAYAAAGGSWVATYLTGYVDVSNRCWTGGFPGPDLRGTFGLWNEEVDYLHDGETTGLQGCVPGLAETLTATDVVERLHAEGAEPLARIASDFSNGSPAILRHRVQAGSTVYLGARLSEESLVSFYRFLAASWGIPAETLPPGVVRKTRLSADGPLEFLFNYNKHPVTVDLADATYRRLPDGGKLSGSVTLRPYETLLRSLNQDAPPPSPVRAGTTLAHELPIPT